MVFNFYCVKDANNCIQKTLESAKEINITFLNAQDVQTPILRVKTVDIETLLNGGYNYAYIPSLKRYYFVDGATVMLGGLTQLLLNCDYLMSYKDDILKASGYVLGSYADKSFTRNRYEEVDAPTVNAVTDDNPFESGTSFVLVTAV